MTNNMKYGYCDGAFHHHYVGDYHDQCHDYNHPHFHPHCRPVNPNEDTSDENVTPRPTVTSKAILGTEITLVSAEGETFVLELHEGDMINNLRYLDDSGVEYSISGYLKAIKHNISNRIVTESCVHASESTFSHRVSTTTLVIDCSRENKSDIRLIPIKNIIGFESNTLANDLSITGVKLLGINELSFLCSEKPVAVIWNGHGVSFETRDANPDIYYVDIDTMKKHNVLSVITATSMATISDIPTIYPYACPMEEMEPEISKAIEVMMTTDYATSESGEVTPDNIHSLMVRIAKNVGYLDELIVNDTVLRKEGSSIINVKGVPISMNNFNIDNLGNLYLPVPLIFHLLDTTTGTLNLTLGEFDLVSTPPVTISALSLVDTSIVNGSSELNKVETDFENDVITLTRYDSTAGVGINLKTADDQEIPDNTAVFANIAMSINEDDDVTDNKFVYLTTVGNDITLVHDITDNPTEINKTTFKVVMVVPNYGVGCVTVVVNNEVPPTESEPDSDETESM